MIDVMDPVVIPEKPATPSPPTANEVETLLDGLGTTCEQVAQTLISLGITGRRNSAIGCPVASYLNQHYRNHGFRASVGGLCGYLDNLGRDRPVKTVRFGIPNPCVDFISLFDSGHIPELVAERSL